MNYITLNAIDSLQPERLIEKSEFDKMLCFWCHNMHDNTILKNEDFMLCKECHKEYQRFACDSLNSMET